MPVRLAKQTDVAEMAQLFTTLLTETPYNLHLYANCTPEEYTRHRSERLTESIEHKAKQVLLYEDDEGMILGCLVYWYHGMEDRGFEDRREFPPVCYPEGIDVVQYEAWKKQKEVWAEELMGKVGPHIRGDVMCVLRDSRSVGVGSALCLAVKADAESLKVPVFFDTNPFSMAYYERFAHMQHLRVKFHGYIHHIPGPCALTSYMVQLLPEERTIEEEVKSGKGHKTIEW